MPNSLMPSTLARAPRPRYLAVSLVLAAMLGLGGLTNGCGTIQFYRQSTHAALPSDGKMDPELRAWMEVVHQARNEGLVTWSKRIVPLASANTLLSFLLLIASVAALAGRPRADVLALQATFANIAYTVIAFVLERPLRAHVIDAAMRAPPGVVTLAERLPNAEAWWWAYRFMFAAQLIALAAIAFALTRPRAAAFFGQGDNLDEEA